jgi:diguanylate cyclase (GGDEF)-like protein
VNKLLKWLQPFIRTSSPQVRCLLFIQLSIPMLLLFCGLQDYALKQAAAGAFYDRQGLILGQILVSATILVLLVAGLYSWVRRHSESPDRWLVQLVLVATIGAYSLLMVGYGLKDSPLAILVLQGIVVGRALFNAKTLIPALVVAALMMVGSEILVARQIIHYAPMLSAPIYTGQPLGWWWGLWGRVIFYVGSLGFAGLLFFFFNMFSRQRHQLEELVRTDALTGLANRRTFMTHLEVESHRAIRYQRPFCLILCDIDHFKKINDTWGHPAGDEVLAEVGRILRTMTRKQVDVPARIGGEEFVILLPETRLPEAHKVAEKISTQLRGHAFHVDGEHFSITQSIGIAEAVDASPEHVLRRADRNLYRAKRAGRDKVVGSIIDADDETNELESMAL